MYCRFCGNKMPDDSVFCPKCGKSLDSENQADTLPQTANSAPTPKLGMKWYKFLIYFSLFFGAFLYLVYGYQFLTGSVYAISSNGEVTAELVYEFYGPLLHFLDVFYGISTIALAVFSIVVRNKLAKFNADALTWFYAYQVGNIIVGAVYIIGAALVTGQTLSETSIGNLIGSLILLFINVRYFTKREYLFTGVESRVVIMPDATKRTVCEKVKDWAAMTFGAFGLFILLALSYILNFAPLTILHFPFWLDCILIFAMTSVPFLNIIVNLVIWIWAFVVAVTGPQSALTVIFYIVFILNSINILTKIGDSFR